jgi:hypothetical protein
VKNVSSVQVSPMQLFTHTSSHITSHPIPSPLKPHTIWCIHTHTHTYTYIHHLSFSMNKNERTVIKNVYNPRKYLILDLATTHNSNIWIDRKLHRRSLASGEEGAEDDGMVAVDDRSSSKVDVADHRIRNLVGDSLMVSPLTIILDESGVGMDGCRRETRQDATRRDATNNQWVPQSCY